MITKEQKTAVIEANKRAENDTGSPEVQIAILTERIGQLTEQLRVLPLQPGVPDFCNIIENIGSLSRFSI